MAAQFIEEQVEDVNADSLEVNEELQDLQESEEDNLEVEEEVASEPEEDDDLPEKYKGKTASQIAKMHQEAEKLVGRQSTEVGELRRLVDDYVKPTPPPAQETEEDIDFFDNPREAVNQAVSNNPALQEIKELQKSLKQQELVAKLSVNHSDYKEVVQDEAFATWVQSSPVRTELYQRADSGFDYNAADELLSTWKERSQAITQAKSTAKKDVKEQRKAASTGSSKGTGESSPRKIYRRSDIMNLMRNDPERYLELSDEILQAYADKRVR